MKMQPNKRKSIKLEQLGEAKNNMTETKLAAAEQLKKLDSHETQEEKRKTRSDKGKARLTERDVKILTWMGEQYAIRLDYLQELLGRIRQPRPKAVDPETGEIKTGAVSISTANSAIKKWADNHLVKTVRARGDRPTYAYLTAAGLREVGLPYRDTAPSLARIRHIDAGNKVRMRLAELYPTAIWVSERELLQRVNRLSEKERSKIDHVPDAELHMEDGRLIIIEIELTRKTRERTSSIMRGLKQRYNIEHNPQVEIWYFVTPETNPIVKEVAFNLNKDGVATFTEHQLKIKTLHGGYD